MLGCAPAEIEKYGTNGKPCVEWINGAVSVFNDRLKPLVDELNVVLPDAKFTFINMSNILAPRGGKRRVLKFPISYIISTNII